ncbi:hypothetical protein [Cupriavidus sp. D39]|uniref:hypothetical protein n=1 Tax=Cupriavidus sp. D39 TaxID=2997877 RepID=UPI0022712B56|nr:hypothetical protein [Cupriavidus sp. D39]MCY0858331.1 hypothetical protein [Cupriavidus sp. D39]
MTWVKRDGSNHSKGKSMKSLLIAALVAVTLSGCVIVPARPAYYHSRAPVFVY